jgi:hypothetical protein
MDNANNPLDLQRWFKAHAQYLIPAALFVVGNLVGYQLGRGARAERMVQPEIAVNAAPAPKAKKAKATKQVAKKDLKKGAKSTAVSSR